MQLWDLKGKNVVSFNKEWMLNKQKDSPGPNALQCPHHGA